MKNIVLGKVSLFLLVFCAAGLLCTPSLAETDSQDAVVADASSDATSFLDQINESEKALIEASDEATSFLSDITENLDATIAGSADFFDAETLGELQAFSDDLEFLGDVISFLRGSVDIVKCADTLWFNPDRKAFLDAASNLVKSQVVSYASTFLANKVALAGAAKSAKAGAIIGSIVPGKGTAIGAVIGGIGGYFAGGWLAKEASTGVANSFYDKYLDDLVREFFGRGFDHLHGEAHIESENDDALPPLPDPTQPSGDDDIRILPLPDGPSRGSPTQPYDRSRQLDRYSH